jgi:hypothetical protein
MHSQQALCAGTNHSHYIRKRHFLPYTDLKRVVEAKNIVRIETLFERPKALKFPLTKQGLSRFISVSVVHVDFGCGEAAGGVERMSHIFCELGHLAFEVLILVGVVE